MANNELKSMYKSMGIPEAVYDFCDEIWEGLKPRFEKIKECVTNADWGTLEELL